MKKEFIYIAILTGCCILSALPVMAQPSLPSNAPIDGGLSLLIAGGVGYGVKKIKDNRNKKEK